MERRAEAAARRRQQHIDGDAAPQNFEVERIVARRQCDGTACGGQHAPREEFLVRWRHYAPDEATWEPEEHIVSLEISILIRFTYKSRTFQREAETRLQQFKEAENLHADLNAVPFDIGQRMEEQLLQNASHNFLLKSSKICRFSQSAIGPRGSRRTSGSRRTRRFRTRLPRQPTQSRQSQQPTPSSGLSSARTRSILSSSVGFSMRRKRRYG